MKLIFAVLALGSILSTQTHAQTQSWAKAIYQYGDEFVVLTRNFAMLSINKEGQAAILLEADENLKEIVPVYLHNVDDNASAYLQKDGSYMLLPSRFNRKKAYTVTPKGKRKYLNSNPDAYTPIVIWGDEKSVVLEMLEDKRELVIPLPGKPVAAIGMLENMIVSVEPENKPGTLENYKIQGKDMKKITPLQMEGEVVSFYSHYTHGDMIITIQRNQGLADFFLFNIYGQEAKFKVPGTGKYEVTHVQHYGYIKLVTESQEYWEVAPYIPPNGKPPFTRYVLPKNLKVLAAGLGNDLLGSDNKIYYRTNSDGDYTIIDVASLKKLYTGTQAGTTVGPAVPLKTVSLSPVPDLNFSQQPNEVVKDYYAAVFPAFSGEDRTRCIEYSDLNNDGKKDMIISYNRAPYFDILFGDGSGLFPKKARVKYGPGKGLMVKAADFNKDNKTDLLICHPADSTLTIFTQTSTNSFKGQKLTAEKSNYFELLDYNADKHPDIILDGAILLNNGKGQFIPYQTDKTEFDKIGLIMSNSLTPSPLGAMADLNGDGTLDFIKITGSFKGDKMTQYGGIEIKLMPSAQKLSQAKTNTYHRSFTVVANENLHAIGAGDFDGNGTTDLVASYQNESKVSFFMNNGNGESFEQKDFQASMGMPYKIEVLDFDKDGKVDAAINIGLKPQIFGFDGNGKVVRKYHSGLSTDIGASTANGNFADLNGDGLTDYIALNDHKALAGTEFDCGAERCFSVNSFLGSKSGGSFAFTEKTMPAPVVTYTTTSGGEGSGTSGTSTGGNGGSTTGTKTAPGGNYKKGLAKFKGVGEKLTSLVIEVEAEVLYETKTDKGVYGFKYQNIADAKGIRFRYPGNSTKWYSFGSGDYVHKCTESNGTEHICATIQGAVFILGIPEIY